MALIYQVLTKTMPGKKVFPTSNDFAPSGSNIRKLVTGAKTFNEGVEKCASKGHRTHCYRHQAKFIPTYYY